jgi:hypothetical protein
MVQSKDYSGTPRALLSEGEEWQCREGMLEAPLRDSPPEHILIQKRRSLGILLFLAVLAAPLFAQDNVQDNGEEGDYLTVKIAVMGPGDELYYWWGHIALIVEMNDLDQSRLYDYGLFSFDSENFFFNFAMGRLLYSCGVSWTKPNIDRYIRSNRDVRYYTLNLPLEKKEAIWNFAEENTLPENRDYWYHHFKDNCSTRIRDIIDYGLDGRFSEALYNAPGRFTLRQHVRRHTYFSPFYDWLLNFLMGQDIDTPLTVWEEMFLPAEVGHAIENFTYTDNDGVERKLLSKVEVIHRGSRPPVLDKPRRQWLRELVLGGVLAAALIVILVLRARGGKAARLLWGISQSALGLFFGFAGLVLFFMSFFTNHDYTYHNINIIYINFLLLAAVPLGVLYCAAWNDFDRALYGLILKALWSYVLVFGVLSLMLRALPWFWQQNQVTLALVLPFAAVLSFLPDLIVKLKRQVFWRWFG